MLTTALIFSTRMPASSTLLSVSTEHVSHHVNNKLSKMSVVTTILICSLVLATNTRGSEIIWREGKRYEICVRDDGTYLVTVNGELWLASSPIVNRIFANGNWNQLKLAGKEQQNGSTPGLGQFSAISLSLQTAGSDSIRLVNTIKYYTKHDLFLFETVSRINIKNIN